MTNASRWLLLLPLLIAAAAVPMVLALRDPLHEARTQLASMTPAQRKEIERHREAYDRLTALEQYELRQLNEELDKLSPKERAELEALMGRLQAWVATFPDDLRAKYDNGMPSERTAILKSQLKSLEQERSRLVAQVQRVDEAATRADAGKPPLARPPNLKQLERQLPIVERWVRTSGTEDEQKLVKLVRDSDRLLPLDKWIVLHCVSSAGNAKGMGKRMVKRGEAPDPTPYGLLHRLTFVPAFAPSPGDPKKSSSDETRTEVSKALTQLYLLQPSDPPTDSAEVYRRLGLDSMFQQEPKKPQPIYLLQQAALLKDYSEGKATPPLKDIARVKSLLGKSP